MTIIVPTLNEAGNIKRIIRILNSLYSGCTMIVADDGSTDGTKEIVKIIEERNAKVRLLDRSNAKKHGITASVVDAAMRVKTLKMIVMDGDLQHPPNKVIGLYRGLERYDMTIGVRTTVRNWGFHRIILSKGIARFSYAVFKLRGKQTCNDLMSGFFGIRTNIIRKIIKENRSGFVYTGYKVLLDILRLADKKMSVCEVPYSTFHMRKAGKSKLGPKQMLDVLLSTLK